MQINDRWRSVSTLPRAGVLNVPIVFPYSCLCACLCFYDRGQTRSHVTRWNGIGDGQLFTKRPATIEGENRERLVTTWRVFLVCRCWCTRFIRFNNDVDHAHDARLIEPIKVSRSAATDRADSSLYCDEKAFKLNYDAVPLARQRDLASGNLDWDWYWFPFQQTLAAVTCYIAYTIVCIY